MDEEKQVCIYCGAELKHYHNPGITRSVCCKKCNGWFVQSSTDHRTGKTTQHEPITLKAENEKLRKSKGWVSVKDKPIPYDDLVVTLVEMSDGDFEYHLICVDGSNGEILDMEGELHDCWSIGDYTYWMPLPKLPEEE